MSSVFFWLTNVGVVRLHSAAAGDAEGAGNGGDNGDDEVNDVFQCFFFHNGLIFFKWLMFFSRS